ncbi:PAS domain-containing sensor histidine kinase [Sphingosinicella sp. CPCC 101087]|uniref:hybrid sensor histidine kinase/response regulator n=1 Tax=Sphingosinicella sp. CPCC 101087 TaxID=2497754 RepID=UPI001981E6E1|nr:PAS domain-containing hybrid sensor histidine kinase/response regulator [Sphingosinicella sp. CPCC 101087]
MSIEQPCEATDPAVGDARSKAGRFPVATGRATSVRDYEEELRRQEDLHRLACEAGRTGSWYVSLESMECTLSPMAAALLGLPAQAFTLPAETWRARIGSAHLAGLEEAVRASAADGRPFEFEFMVTRSDSRELWLHLRGEVVTDVSGRPSRVHGALVDLTEQKRAKDELERLNETLELRVAERTAALLETQEALRQAQKVEAMGQLTGGIAHDFNNLLTPILANLDLLRHSATSERDRRLIEGALRSAGSAQALVQRLLAFARRQALEPTRVELPALIEDLAELVSRTLGPRIQIALDLAPGLQPALADRNQLEMAILNLSVNARDAMPEGGTLTISAANEIAGPGHEARLPPGGYVRLSIVDTGFGMDEKVLRRAVEPFFSTKGVGKGTGLGLSMVDGLASQMGGAFSLRSEPGSGTAATLWLPIWVGPARTDASPRPAAPAFAHEGVALLVDDHDLVRASTAEMLGDLGYRVVEAGSGEEAIQLIDGGLHADLMVTDHLMPGISGAQLADLARSRLPGLPVLLVTGFTRPDGVPADLPCLTKPFRKAVLAERIARLRRPAIQPAH